MSKGKNEKVIGLMKDELGIKVMIIFVGLRAKTCLSQNENLNLKIMKTV